MDPAFPSLSEWTRRRRTAASRAWVIVLVMLGLLGLHAQGQPGAAFAIVCLGAALAWVVGVRLVALEMLLVDLGRRRRVEVEQHRHRVLVLAVLAFACEASSAAGITGLLFVGQVHPLSMLLALVFGVLAMAWKHVHVRRGTSSLAQALGAWMPGGEAR